MMCTVPDVVQAELPEKVAHPVYDQILGADLFLASEHNNNLQVPLVVYVGVE